MTRGRAAVVTAALCSTCLTLLVCACGGSSQRELRLLDSYSRAERQTTLDPIEAFSIVSVSLDGQGQRALLMRPPSRVTWKIAVPPHATLHLSLGVAEAAWTQPGDGVGFRVTVNDRGAGTEVFSRILNPFRNRNHRHWVPVEVDVAAYGGRTVALVFETFSSAPGDVPDPRGDLALWAEPRIVSR